MRYKDVVIRRIECNFRVNLSFESARVVAFNPGVDSLPHSVERRVLTIC